MEVKYVVTCALCERNRVQIFEDEATELENAGWKFNDHYEVDAYVCTTCQVSYGL